MTTSDTTVFLADRVARYDVLLIHVKAALGSQKLRARVEKIYSSGKAISLEKLDNDIEFIHAPAHWGNTALKPGELAFIFVSKISDLIYEASWNGHMVVEDLDGIPHATIKLAAMWERAAIPPLIRQNARPVPNRPYASAVRFDAMESYLKHLIQAKDRG